MRLGQCPFIWIFFWKAFISCSKHKFAFVTTFESNFVTRQMNNPLLWAWIHYLFIAAKETRKSCRMIRSFNDSIMIGRYTENVRECWVWKLFLQMIITNRWSMCYFGETWAYFNYYKKINKTKSLKSREKGELKLKRWMVIKVNRWIKLIDE